jgi:hypothetical protein
MAKKKHKPDPLEGVLIRQRKGNTHITNNGSKGYTKTHSQIHHIVCITCMQDAKIADTVTNKKDLEFIRKCLKITKWDINEKPNTIGLPLTPAYYRDWSKGWDGFPCHQVDHDLYYADVSGILYSNVWEPLLIEREECNIDEKACATELNNVSSFFEGELKTRGKGTLHCWENRDKPALENSWYIPFSMAILSTPRKRKPPPDLSEAIKKKMKQLFQAIAS